jgi:hypothetical protein
MRVLFDQGTPVPLRHELTGHTVSTAYELGWATMTNGELLGSAERMGFEVLVTTDTNLRHQQNLALRQIAVVVLSTTNWPRIRAAAHSVKLALDSASAGAYVEVQVP